MNPSVQTTLSRLRDWVPVSRSQAYVRQRAIHTIFDYEKRGLEAVESLASLLIHDIAHENSFSWPSAGNDDLLYKNPPPPGYVADVYFGEGRDDNPNLPPMVLNEFYNNVGLTGMESFAHSLSLVIRDATTGEYVAACCFEFLRLVDRGGKPRYAVYVPVIGSTIRYDPDEVDAAHDDNQSISNYMLSYARWLSKRLNGDHMGFILAQSVGYVMTGTISNPKPRADPSSHGRSGRKFWERHSSRTG